MGELADKGEFGKPAADLNVQCFGQCEQVGIERTGKPLQYGVVDVFSNLRCTVGHGVSVCIANQ